MSGIFKLFYAVDFLVVIVESKMIKIAENFLAGEFLQKY
jgi:hypothetical protein